MPPTNDTYGAVVEAGAVWHAVSFTMSAQSVPVDLVELRLIEYNTTAGDLAAVGIYNDNGADGPGSVVGDLLVNPPSNSNTIGQFNFFPSVMLTLEASTKYWLVVNVTVGHFQWQGSFPAKTPTSQVGASFGTQMFLSGSGNQGPVQGISNFEIVTGIPEPGTNLLTIGTLAALIPFAFRQY